MVPTAFLIDEKGRIVRRLVGQKDKVTLQSAFDDLIGARVTSEGY